MPQFIPGLQLAREFYTEAVHPLLEEHFPRCNTRQRCSGPRIANAGGNPFDGIEAPCLRWRTSAGQRFFISFRR